MVSALALTSCGCSKRAAKTVPATPRATVVTPAFSADSAYSYVARQVEFGPRVPGSEAHEACAGWLSAELRRHGADSVIVQTAELPGFGPMTNILGRFNRAESKRVLLIGHWDSRPWADNDPDPANHSKPIDGANDGASAVGVLLEIARLIGRQSPQVGVDILFVDAEDSGTEGNDESWARGARYWAKNLPYGSECPLPSFGVLLDMVGGRNAVFPREMFSDYRCRPVNDRIWALAAANGLASRFPDQLGGAVNDDHLPIIDAGIPTVDIIETDNPQTGSFNPTWHTLDDDISNIDKTTLGDVGRLVTLLIYSEQL